VVLKDLDSLIIFGRNAKVYVKSMFSLHLNNFLNDEYFL